MTIEKLIKALKNCNSGDPETDHINADKLLLKFIGDTRVTKAFFDIEKWYA